MKIAIIGAGNMGGATALGLKRFCPDAAITVTARHPETLAKYDGKGTPATRKTVLDLFGAVGKVQLVNEKQLATGTMVASCGTAFALRYVRAATEGGVQLGLYPAQALEAALQTVKGAADLVFGHGTHPEQEIDRVTTPDGITIRGLNAMEEAGFSNAVIKGLIIK